MTKTEIARLAEESGMVPKYTRPQDSAVKKGYAVSGEFMGYATNMESLERFVTAIRSNG